MKEYRYRTESYLTGGLSPTIHKLTVYYSIPYPVPYPITVLSPHRFYGKVRYRTLFFVSMVTVRRFCDPSSSWWCSTNVSPTEFFHQTSVADLDPLFFYTKIRVRYDIILHSFQQCCGFKFILFGFGSTIVFGFGSLYRFFNFLITVPFFAFIRVLEPVKEKKKIPTEKRRFFPLSSV
jgi:hypothetical protein